MYMSRSKRSDKSKSEESSSVIQEYDEILNQYHQKNNSKVTKKRLNELIQVCNNKLSQGEVLDFTRNLEDCLKVSLALHTQNSQVDDQD